MSDRGFALADALVATALMAVICMAAADMLVALPSLAANWDEAADARQRLRVAEGRIASVAAGAGPILVEAGGRVARVPSVWPRRLGLWRSDAPAVVASSALTIIARADGHRLLMTAGVLGAAGGVVDVVSGDGCGTPPACGLAPGDLVLVVSRESACGLFRVLDADARLALDALMPGAAETFEPGAVVVPVGVTVLAFEPADGELRLYDGYRSDNVLIDGVAAFEVALESGAPPLFDPRERGGPFVDDAGVWKGTGTLGDGPFIGAGSMAFDVDQLLLSRVSASIALAGAPGRPSFGGRLEWGVPPWPWPPPSS